MKRIAIFLLFLIPSFTYATNEVEITVSGSGTSKEEAISNALRSAIEQTYGAFVSSNTTILNDKIVKDDIVSLSSGNIKEYKILAEEAISPDKFFVVLKAVVNIGEVVTYVHGTSNEVEVDLEAFDANVRLAEMNSKAERQIVENVIAQIQSINDLWDYSIQIDDPKVKGDNYVISGVVSVKYNKNTCNAIDLLINMFNSISLTENEAKKIISTHYNSFYQIPVIGGSKYAEDHNGGTTNHWPIVYLFPIKKEIRLRNTYHNDFIDETYINPRLFASKIKFIVEPFNRKFSCYASCGTSPRKYAGYVGSSCNLGVVGEGSFVGCIDGRASIKKNDYGVRNISGLLLYGNYIDLHGHGVLERKHKVGDIVLEIEVFFEVPREEVRNIKKITVQPINEIVLEQLQLQRKEHNNMSLSQQDILEKATMFSKEKATGTHMAETSAIQSIDNEEDAEYDYDDQIYTISEISPEFPGGVEAIERYLRNNIRYPQVALENNISGTVYVTFVVEQDGSITNPRVLRGIGGGCDQEAVRLVKSMPKWIPGKQRGKPVRVQFNLPIRFFPS